MYSLAVFDLTKLNLELGEEKNTVVFFIEFEFDIDARLENQITKVEGTELAYSIDALFINYLKGLNSLSKIDTFQLDGNAKLLVDNREGELYSSIDLISSLSNRIPINVTLVGHRDNIFSNTFLPNALRFNFQTKIELATSIEGRQLIYFTNAYNDVSKFELVDDPSDEKYGKIIKTHEGDEGSVFFNQIDNTYLYCFEIENKVRFKLYDKNNNFSLYENSNGMTKLLQTSTYDGKTITYTWSIENLLTKIENSDGDLLQFTYGSDNDYILNISDSVSEYKVEFGQRHHRVPSIP